MVRGSDRVVISVTDTGPGVPVGFRGRIFDKFFRLEHQQPEGRPHARGAGIGLYMCRQIVELHEGRIECTAGENGRGTRITVDLPVGGTSDGDMHHEASRAGDSRGRSLRRAGGILHRGPRFVAPSAPARGVIESSQVQRPVIRGGVDAVALNVTATDPGRHYVTDLARDDFLIFEDGRRQDLTFFQKTGLPLALVLLLDTSASMNQSLAVAQEAAIGFARQLGPSDLASVIDFDSTVHVRQGFTSDREAIERAIRQTAANGSTALYNAVYIALKESIKSPRDERTAEPRRRAIVVLSDGDDTSSLVGFDEVLDLAARGDTTIYAIGLGCARRRPRRAPRMRDSS